MGRLGIGDLVVPQVNDALPGVAFDREADQVAEGVAGDREQERGEIVIGAWAGVGPASRSTRTS